MSTKLPLLRLALLAGLVLPAPVLSADPLNMPPSANDPVNSTPPQPKSSAAEAARAAQESVVTSNSVMENARREIAASREEARRNLDAGVRGQTTTPPSRVTRSSEEQAALESAAEGTGAFDGLSAQERAEAQQAIDRMSTFGQGDCEEIDYSGQKAKVRTGLTQGQQYSLQNEAAMRASGQAELIALADRLQKQREAYGNTDERVAQVGGECDGDAGPKPGVSGRKSPGSKGPKGPKAPAGQGPKTPEGGSGPTQPAQPESNSVVGGLLTQAADVKARLDYARLKQAEIDRQDRDAIAHNRPVRPRNEGDVQLARDIAYMERQLVDLERRIQIEERRGVRDQMQPGLTPDGPRSLPQHQPNETRTTEQLRRDLERENLDAQSRLKDLRSRYAEMERQDQAAAARNEPPRPRTAEDEQIRREILYQEGRLNRTGEELRNIADGAKTPRDLEDQAAATQRRLNDAVRVRENAARQREAAIARGETPPDTTARDRDLDREISRMRGEIEDLDAQLSEANPGRARPITDPKTGATMRTPAPKPKP